MLAKFMGLWCTIILKMKSFSVVYYDQISCFVWLLEIDDLLATEVQNFSFLKPFFYRFLVCLLLYNYLRFGFIDLRDKMTKKKFF